MATLTTSWQNIASWQWNAGTGFRVTFYVDAKINSQSVANNTSVVATRLTSIINSGSGSGSNYKFTCTYAPTKSGSGTWTFSNETITSGSATVAHNSDGTKSVTIKATVKVANAGLSEHTLSATATLPRIDRIATVTSGTDFTDETNPKITFTNPAGFNISPYINVYNSNETLVYQLVRNRGTYSSPYTWSLSDAERNAIRAACNTQKSYKVYEGLLTYNGSTYLGSHSVGKTMTIVNANPTFNATYEDTNASTIAITGNNQLLIQNQSTLQINVTDATAYKSATLSTITALINGTTYNGTISGSTATFNIGTLNISENTNAVITLTDSRGYTSTQTLALQIEAWSLPTANISLARQNNYYSATDINVDANYDDLDGQNTITIQVRYKKTSDVNYGNWQTLQDGVTSTLTLDNLYEWDVQVKVTDVLGSTTYNLTLDKGMPIIFFDRLKRSVGINCFPNDSESLEAEAGNSQINIVDKILELINKTIPIELYNHTTGSNGNVLLSDSAANYEYLEILYRTNDSDYSSVRVYQPNGKNVSLFGARPNGSTLRVYGKYRVVNINGTSISTISNGAVQFTAIQGNQCAVVSESDIYITRVIGFNKTS